jgi:RHS repeat-associated protein
VIGGTGEGSGGDNDPFKGKIDELRLYSGALTQAQIQAVMSTPLADTVAPAAPAGLAASAAGAGQINLAWSPSTDNVGVTGYRVERCAGAGCGSFAQIATPTGTSFSDTGLAATTSYSYRVRAADAAGNLSAYSNVASATTQGGQLYYIVPDHLNTPRMIANQQGATVWKWEQQEPFGATPPNDNPSGLGAFDFPLRFPGQYFDKETGLTYNWMRDYDAAIGRYSETDPIGLRAGPNLYAYVGGNPIAFTDPAGLELVCTYMTSDIYKRTETVKVEEKGYWRKCTVRPIIGPPLPPHEPPRRRGRGRFPAVEPHWEVDCKEPTWVVTQPEAWEQRISYWLPQWYDCVDTCTGKTSTIALPPQEVTK